MILGIDPGADTAYVVRDGDRLIDRICLEDLVLEGPGLATSIDLVVATAADLTACHPVRSVAVEGAVAPTAYNHGKIRMIDPAPIIGTAHLVGAIVVSCAAVIVPPAGHGDKIPAGTPARAARQMLERLYPPELIGPRETTGRSKTPRQHLRAAWDIAGSARRTARIVPLDL